MDTHRSLRLRWVSTSSLKIISLIGDGPAIEKILRHLKLWDRPERPPPPAPDRTISYDPDIPGFEEVSRWSDATE